MEKVIGQYAGFESARRAVRGLEGHGISIQNVFIADQDLRFGRGMQMAPAVLSGVRGGGTTAPVGRAWLGGLVGGVLAIAGWLLYVGAELDLSPQRLLPMIALAAVSAALGALAMGQLDRRRGQAGSRPNQRFLVVMRGEAPALDAAAELLLLPLTSPA